jgi:hypothetical protein
MSPAGQVDLPAIASEQGVDVGEMFADGDFAD